MTTQPGYTFGIEIECVLIYPSSLVEHQSTRARQILGELVEKQIHERPMRLPCRRFDCNEMHEYPISIFEQEPAYNRYGRWTISYDASVCQTEKERAWLRRPQPPGVLQPYSSYGLEIKSRILNFHGSTLNPDAQGSEHDQETEHGPVEPEWRQEIAHILEQLNAFNLTRDYRCYVNHTCGLHIHIGKAKHELSFDSLRGTLSLFTAFERQMDAVLTTRRIGSWYGDMRLPCVSSLTEDYDYEEDEENESAFYCQPVSTAHIWRLRNVLTSIKRSSEPPPYILDDAEQMEEDIHVGYVPPPTTTDAVLSGVGEQRFPSQEMARSDPRIQRAVRDYHVLGWLYVLNNARTLQDLKDFWPEKNTGGHDSAFNIENIQPQADNQKQTLEIRCHPASLDFGEISPWIDTIVFMVEYSGSVTATELITLATANWGLGEYTFADLAESVGATDATQAFYRDRLFQPNYASQRRDRIVMKQDETSPLAPLLSIVEEDRVLERSQNAVNERIREKFEGGLYGKQPYKLFREIAGPVAADSTEGRQLIISRQDREQWADATNRVASSDETSPPASDDETSQPEPAPLRKRRSQMEEGSCRQQTQ
ncbi:hypothetical protein BDV97DRAFT_89047 [Delphinella strobiligena]|nr:hypothetical protein BDV97DRAFT_89047 [Delphinella strobiligena]